MHEIKHRGRCTRVEFADLMLNAIDDNNFAWQVMFTGEATIRINGRVERHKFYNSYHGIYLGILQLLVSWHIEAVNKKV